MSSGSELNHFESSYPRNGNGFSQSLHDNFHMKQEYNSDHEVAGDGYENHSRKRNGKKPTYNENTDSDVKSEVDSEKSFEPEKKKKKKDKDKKKKDKKAKKRKHDESEEESEDAKKSKKKKKKDLKSEDEDDYQSDYEVKKKKKDKKEKKDKKDKKDKKGKKSVKVKKEEEEVASPEKKGRKKKVENEEHIWKWWEEEKPGEGIKWRTLEHQGPVFPPDYEPLPANVRFYYDGKPMKLTPETEEVATFYAKMLDHDYTSKDSFNSNFFADWRKVMTKEEKTIINDLKKCNFREMDTYFKEQSELRKNMSKEEKELKKKENEEMINKYGVCLMDGHKQKIGNFRIEPPGLFRGRGEHPKMGKLKKRVQAEDIILNIGKEAKVPTPPPGHKWKEVRHDSTVTWLASWTENIMGNVKYIMLNPSSKMKSIKDWQKYEKARELKKIVSRIRNDYRADFKSREMVKRQRAVALYFIDKLALRAGNEKDDGETADTVGCCSLRFEHITLHEEKDDQQFVVEFDFLGKDSIRYQNSIPVEKRVFKNLKHFMQGKSEGDDLFDRLNTASLNKYLNSLMDGLTAKVFRTFNASNTLQEQLNLLTKDGMTVPELMLAYNRANRAVAILCNHQRAVPKTFDKQMENLEEKIKDKKKLIKEAKKEYKESKKSDKAKAEKLKKKLATLEDQLKKLEVQRTDKEENKQIALGTSKLNYLDPRISVAWCKKWNVPLEKVYNKTQRDKFRWAIEMVDSDYQF